MADELILTLDFETPPRADELGRVFAALARDYRDMTKGRVLVITRFESGSIVATLTDLVLAAGPYVIGGVATVQALNALAQFAKTLNEWFSRAKSDQGEERLYRKGKKAPGQSSAEAMIKIAASTGGHVRMKHKTENGETLELELTPAEAKKILEQAQEPTKVAQLEHGQRMPREVQLAIEQLHHAGGSNLSSTEVLAVVDLVVALIQRAGLQRLLPEIASDFELRGLHNFASALRQRISLIGRQP